MEQESDIAAWDDLEDIVPEAEEYEHWRVVADPGQSPLRVDKFLMDHLAGTSRNRVQAAAEAGYIRVNGRAVKSNYKVKPHDVVTLMLDHPKREWTIVAEDLPIDVVYEDDDLLVVNKRAGMVVHPGCGNYSGTLINALAYHLRDNPLFDANSPEVGLCHRIDKDTSGLLVVAKTPEAKADICRQFFVKSTKREYYALVWGAFPESDGRVEGAIGRDPRNRLLMTVLPPDNPNGKPAVTHYHVMENFGAVTLVRCVLETGRTHQIRVHMKHIGHTLFADEVYGGCEILRGEKTASYKAFIHNCLELCPRQALHARTLGFRHPRTGKEMYFECPLPEDMSQLIEKWRRKQ